MSGNLPAKFYLKTLRIRQNLIVGYETRESWLLWCGHVPSLDGLCLSVQKKVLWINGGRKIPTIKWFLCSISLLAIKLNWSWSKHKVVRDFQRFWLRGRIQQWKRQRGRVSSERQNAFISVKRDKSVNTYSRFSTVPWGSERSEWASPWTEWASEVSIVKRSAAERVSGVSGASERT